MFSFNQDTIDQSVDRFFNSTSGPLRDMISQSNNVENLKAIFRDTNAQLGGRDQRCRAGKHRRHRQATPRCWSSVRVTVTDLDGNNKPSQPYRLRVIVQQDDNGQMTAYDLKYPDGGN